MENRVYCLYRVSTRKQADFNAENQADIPMQRKACREFAGQMGWQILYEGQETGVSGFKVSEKDRDVLQRIKEHALQRKFDILLVFMFDRIGRKADESPFVVEWFVRHGIRVWSVKEGEQRFDHHIDTLLNYIRFWQADGESRKTSVRTKEGLRQLVLDGGYRGGGVPYGYRLIATGRLNKRIFDLCIVHGYGRCRIATELNRQGIRNRKGENWHEASIGHILHNPCYTGVLRSGDAVSQRFEHLMILTPELFEQAQALQKARQNEADGERTVPVNVTGNSLLSGNIYCGHCGGRLVLTSNCKSYVTADGNKVKHRRTRYVCYQKTRHRCVCDGQTGYTAHILDEKVEIKSTRRDFVVKQLRHILGYNNDEVLLKLAAPQNVKVVKHYLDKLEQLYKIKEETSQYRVGIILMLFIDRCKLLLPTIQEKLSVASKFIAEYYGIEAPTYRRNVLYGYIDKNNPPNPLYKNILHEQEEFWNMLKW